MQRGQRNMVILRDVGGGLLENQAGEYQVSAVGRRRQRRGHLAPALGSELLSLAPHPVQLLELPGSVEIARPVFALQVQNGLRIQSVGDRCKSSRLGEANEVGRNGHAHFVASSLQLPSDNDSRLDIAATPIARENEFHRWLSLS